MSRTRASKVVATLAVSLALALVVVVSSRSHEADLDQDVAPGDTPGPDPGKAILMPTGRIALEIWLSAAANEPTEWQGDIEVSEGKVAGLEVVRGGPDAAVEGNHFALTATPQKKAAAKNKKGMAKKALAKKQQFAKAQLKNQAVPLAAVLRVTLEAPATASVRVRTDRGEFTLVPDELSDGRTRTFLDGRAAVERQTATVRLTGPKFEDDFPAAARGPDGSVWLVSTEYKPDKPRIMTKGANLDFDDLVAKNNGDRIRLRQFSGKTWQPALAVTDGGLDVWRPTVAVDGQGVVWVAWAQQVDGDWEIYRRGYTPPKAPGEEGTWTDTIRVTQTPGSDIHVVAATDSEGTVWLAWQSWRKDNYEIVVAAQREGHPWNTPRAISESPANDWGPAIAADGKGNVYVAWDTYDRGNYDVRLRTVGKGDAASRAVAESPRFEGRPHLACDKAGRLWIAYEEGDEQWGKDFAHLGDVTNVGLKKNPGFALYVNRTVRVKCLADDQLLQTAAPLDAAFAGRIDRNKSVPRIAADDDGGLWLLVRHHPGPGGQGEVWAGSALRYDGKAWTAPRKLANSTNLIDNRPALAAVGSAVLAVYSSDSRYNTENRKQDDLFAAYLEPEGPASKSPDLVAADRAPAATLETVHPDEPADVARIRAYRVEAEGKSLRLLRGEFHRHTEFSSHNDQDGLLEDAWRYALDAARLDWMGDGDHDNGFGHEYMWWLIQKVADQHHNPPNFIPAQTYERSVQFPNGHRNVMMPKRGIRPLPRGELPGTPENGSPDTHQLYAYLKHFGGICASHTSATDMGTDWRDNDPVVEPVVEVYQGHRHNYETPGAPRAPTAETQIGGYRPAGYIWNALGRGYRLGFQSSSDHVSTHISYAIVLTDDISRVGILEAFRKRHCYAATDNIILDVRSGEHLMGDVFESDGHPTLQIRTEGTAPIARVDIIRDNAYVFSNEPNARQMSLQYSDDEAQPGQSHYYYVRIRQADGNLAWGSPMWINVRKK